MVATRSKCFLGIIKSINMFVVFFPQVHFSKRKRVIEHFASKNVTSQARDQINNLWMLNQPTYLGSYITDTNVLFKQAQA